MDRPRPETDRAGTDPTPPTPPPAPGLPPTDALAPVAAAPEAALIVRGGWQIEGLPATVLPAGPQAAERTTGTRRSMRLAGSACHVNLAVG